VPRLIGFHSHHEAAHVTNPPPPRRSQHPRYSSSLRILRCTVRSPPSLGPRNEGHWCVPPPFLSGHRATFHGRPATTPWEWFSSMSETPKLWQTAFRDGVKGGGVCPFSMSSCQCQMRRAQGVCVGASEKRRWRRLTARARPAFRCSAAMPREGSACTYRTDVRYPRVAILLPVPQQGADRALAFWQRRDEHTRQPTCFLLSTLKPHTSVVRWRTVAFSGRRRHPRAPPFRLSTTRCCGVSSCTFLASRPRVA